MRRVQGICTRISYRHPNNVVVVVCLQDPPYLHSPPPGVTTLLVATADGYFNIVVYCMI